MLTKTRYYFTLLLLLLCSLSAWSQDDFDPSDPPEPGLPPMRLELVVSPSEAGYVYGAGTYVEGTKVNLQATANSGFRFTNWTNVAGDVISTADRFTYTKGEGHERLTANFIFDPDSPDEPVEPELIQYFRLTLTATEGGSVSGGGSYLTNKVVTLRAYPDNQFDFDGWYNVATGEQLSTSTTFYYTTTSHHVTLEGRFVFNPDNPAEPTEPGELRKRTVTATATDGGTVNFSSQRVLVGSAVQLRAGTNSGYTFLGWWFNDEFYSDQSSFSYTVTEAERQDFEARFEFSPDSPSEPQEPPAEKYAFYLLNRVAKPGDRVKFPVYLSASEPLTDLTFQLNFPSTLQPDMTGVELSPQASEYTMIWETKDDTSYVFTLTGGSLDVGNVALLTLPVQVPDGIATAQSYRVTINQVSVTAADGSTYTAATRNGRISVYKLGDSNGDDDINVADLAGVALLMQGDTKDDLIFYAADMDGNEVVEETDFDLLIDSVLVQSVVMRPPALARHGANGRKAPKADSNANKILLDPVVMVSPDDNRLVIPIRLVSDDDITGFQFDIFLQKGVEISTDENGDFVLELSDGIASDHHINTLGQKDEWVRMVCSSKDNNILAGKGGDVIYMTLNVPNPTEGDTYTIDLTNIVLTDNHAKPYAAEDVTQMIVVGAAENEQHLAKGWNWISTNRNDASQREVLTFLAPVADHVQRLVGQTQELVNDSQYGLVGNLQALDVTAAYKLQLDDAATLPMDGAAVSTGTPIHLHQGWNWIGYLPVVYLNVNKALEHFSATAGDRILSQNGFAEYDGSTWVNDFLMKPGNGYMYYAVESADLVYSPVASSPALSKEYSQAPQLPSPWTYDVHRYPDNTTLVARLCLDGQTCQQDDYVVGAFCSGECRGIGQVVGDRLFITIHGTVGSDETVTFAAYEPSTGMQLPVSETLPFQGQCLGSLAAPMQLHLATGIISIDQAGTSPNSSDVYTLSGQLVRRQATTLQGLPRGLYVMGGKIILR